LQQIECGEVTPRIHTLKLIFSALDYPLDDPLVTGNRKFYVSFLFSQLYAYLLDLFNVKTNIMNKILVLAIILSLTGLSIVLLSSGNKAQDISPG
jgi:transcriptional regulator with XRE-family HTH domain